MQHAVHKRERDLSSFPCGWLQEGYEEELTYEFEITQGIHG